MSQSVPNIFEYEEPQDFLRDYIEARKKVRSTFSVREFSSRAGFRSSGALSMVLTGKRQLSLDSASRIAEVVKLKWKEKQYFFLLVRKSQAKNPSEKNKIRDEILKSRFRTRKNRLANQQYRFLSHWYYPAIYLLVGERASAKHVESFDRLLGRGLTKEQIQQALKDMQELGLLKLERGVYRQLHAHLTTDDDIQESATYEFLSQMMELAKMAFELPSEEREFGSITLEIPPSEWPWLKERIREFRQEITDRFGESRNSSGLFQVNIQAFPLTLKEERDSSS